MATFRYPDVSGTQTLAQLGQNTEFVSLSYDCSLSGFSQQYLSGLEKGHRNPTVITLFELANCLETSPDEFLRGVKSDTQTDPPPSPVSPSTVR